MGNQVCRRETWNILFSVFFLCKFTYGDICLYVKNIRYWNNSVEYLHILCYLVEVWFSIIGN